MFLSKCAITRHFCNSGKFTNWLTVFKSRKGRPVKIRVNGLETNLDSKFSIGGSGTVCFARPELADRLTSDELSRMNLKVSFPKIKSFLELSMGKKDKLECK